MHLTRYLRTNLCLLLTALLLTAGTAGVRAEIGPDQLTGEDREHFDRFRDLFQNGTPDEFYAFAMEYEQELKQKDYMMLYYKLKNNEGFFALRHNMLFRAMQAAEELDNELHKDGASDYYYLATGLMGDVYFESHDQVKAEQYFKQALKEVGDKDPKFTMRTCQSLAELLCLKDSHQALEWTQQSMALAKEVGNTEYYGKHEREQVRVNDVCREVMDDYQSKNTKGLDLGLSICRRQARGMGGDVKIDEAYSPGCRFVITLPA